MHNQRTNIFKKSYDSPFADTCNAVLLFFQQYSSGLGQYKDEFSDFGHFDPKEVVKEIKRGKKLVKTLPCILLPQYYILLFIYT